MNDGEEWIKEITGRQSLDLKTRVKAWIKEEFCDQLRLNGDLMPGLEGEYYAKIITDQRPPDSVVVWNSGGFFTEMTY